LLPQNTPLYTFYPIERLKNRKPEIGSTYYLSMQSNSSAVVEVSGFKIFLAAHYGEMSPGEGHNVLHNLRV
jgi:hypothetical protein